jgi:hypothetical protein
VEHKEDNYQYHFVVAFDLKEKLFFVDSDTSAIFNDGVVYTGDGKWINLDEKTEGLYETLTTVLHNALQESNQFVIDAIETELEKEGG